MSDGCGKTFLIVLEAGFIIFIIFIIGAFILSKCIKNKPKATTPEEERQKNLKFGVCPDCGAEMKPKNSQYYCTNCGTMGFDLLVDTQNLKGNFVNMPHEEFAKVLRERTKRYYIRLNKNKSLDVQREIYMAKIKNAENCLDSGDFFDKGKYTPYINESVSNRDRIYSIMKDVPSTIWEAERVRFLADCYVKNEMDLANESRDSYTYSIRHDSQYKDYSWYREQKIVIIDIENNEHFKSILRFADSDTVEAYKAIAESWKRNVKVSKELSKKISDILALGSAGSIEVATKYSHQVCNEYPFKSTVWSNCLGINEFDREIKIYQTASTLDDRHYGLVKTQTFEGFIKGTQKCKTKRQIEEIKQKYRIRERGETFDE